jgi:DNA-binding MarR family transcriptional regulator
MTVYSGGPADSPGFLLWRVTLRWQRAVAEALRPLNLTHVQFVLLASTWWLNEHDQTPNQLAIAAHAATDVKMTSEVLRKLEAKGLVIQRTDAQDRRARSIVVTATGSALVKRAIIVVERVDIEFFGSTSGAITGLLKTLAGFGTHDTTPT